MGNLTEATSLKKTDSHYSKRLQLPKFGKSLNPGIYDLPQPVSLLILATAICMYSSFFMAQ